MNSRLRTVFLAALAVSCSFSPSIGASEFVKRVCINNICVEAEVVSSEAQKMRGLMYRDNLAWESGMLFIFDVPALHSFWMKNMRIPLDIIWIDSGKNIVDITQNALPCKGEQDCESIIPVSDVKYVLEVNAGFSDKNKIRIGDKAEF